MCTHIWGTSRQVRDSAWTLPVEHIRGLQAPGAPLLALDQVAGHLGGANGKATAEECTGGRGHGIYRRKFEWKTSGKT